MVREVYAAVDAGVGKILSRVDPETTVAIMSLHDMSCMSGASFLLPEILTRLGVMRAPLPAPAMYPYSHGAQFARRLRNAYHRLPERIRRPLYELRQYLNRRRLGPGSPIGIDPARTQCFAIDLGQMYSGIRLNLAGREPEGILDPGAESRSAFAKSCRNISARSPDKKRGGRSCGAFCARRISSAAPISRNCPISWWSGMQNRWVPRRPGAARVPSCKPTRRGSARSLRSAHYARTEVSIARKGCSLYKGPGIAPGQLERVVSDLDLAPSFARFLGCEMSPRWMGSRSANSGTSEPAISGQCRPQEYPPPNSGPGRRGQEGKRSGPARVSCGAVAQNNRSASGMVLPLSMSPQLRAVEVDGP